MLRAFKLDHLQPIQLLLFQEIFMFFTFIPLTGNAIGYSAILLSPSRPPALLLPPVENLFYGRG